MAGSKSLELYLPDENTYIDKDVPLINVLPPKRLHDAAGLLNEMLKKVNPIEYEKEMKRKLFDEKLLKKKLQNKKIFERIKFSK